MARVVAAPSPVAIALGAAATGFGLGFLVKKSGLMEANVVSDQISGRGCLALKIFGSAVTTSLAVNVAGHYWFPSLEIPWRDAPAFSVHPAVVGGCFLGAGMYLADATPLTLLTRCASLFAHPSHADQSLPVLLGALSGAFAFGYMNWTLPVDTSPLTLAQLANVPFAAVALPSLALLISGLYLLERSCPSKFVYGLKPANPDESRLVQLAKLERWNPYVCGAAIALVQLPALVVHRFAFNPSDVFAHAASAVHDVLPADALPIGAPSYWQSGVFRESRLAVAAVLGGMAAGVTVASMLGALTLDRRRIAMPRLHRFAGGCLLGVGAFLARASSDVTIAGGCSQLAVASLVSAAASAFGGYCGNHI